MKRQRRIVRVCATLGLVITLASCGGDSEDDPVASPEPAADAEDEGTDEEESAAEAPACTELDQIQIAVPVFPPKFAMITPSMAEELGYFEENCIDAEILTFAAGINALRALQAGEIEIAVPPSASTINAVGEGSPIVGWLSPASQLPQLILATEEVTSCEDLEGRTAATGGPGDLVDHLMATYARTCGLELTQDIDVYIGSAADYGPVLAQDVAQASALHVDDKMVIEQAQSIELRVLEDAATILPDFHYQLLVSRVEYVEQNRDLIVRAAAAMLAANRWITDPANRDDVIATAARVTERNAEIIEFAYDRYAEKFPTTCEEGFRQESLEFTIDLQVEQGNLQEAIPVEDVVDPTVCADAEALLE